MNDSRAEPHTAQQLSADAADLRAGIDDLAGLVGGRMALPDVLAEVAAFAVRAIPGADGVGVALLGADSTKPTALAASDPFVVAIDNIQYDVVNEGPAITAATERRTVRTGSLGGEKMWPRFGPRVGRLGVHSALSLPMLLPDKVIGAIGVYAHAKDVFDDHAAELGELFAKPATVALHNAQILSEALARTFKLQEALATRPSIDQAIGIIRSRTGRSADDALAQLRSMSQADQRKLADVAKDVIDEAVRRARARRA